MKKSFIAALLLTGAAAVMATGAFAQQGTADDPGVIVNRAALQQKFRGANPQNLRVSAGLDPDTVFVGFSYTDHWSATDNWWNIYTGVNRPGINDPNNAIWDWDRLDILAAHGVGDSLAGFWPFLRRWTSATGGGQLVDKQRGWWAIEFGNTANYVINQGAGGKRTYGVVGVWHDDGGAGEVGGVGVTWSPLSGSRSAWCGLRQHGDLSTTDLITGNAFTQALVDRNPALSGIAGGMTYPGYADQWDQMLYRDIQPPAGQPLNISFLYRTRMATGFNSANPATRTGWFHGDPRSPLPGNFISSNDAGTAAPRDSFSVYIGAPVDDNNVLYSDGAVDAVYDPQRRWFSEIIRVFDAPYLCIHSNAGSVPADTAAATPTGGMVVAASQVDAILNAAGNDNDVVRIVFRSHTNRNTSSDDGFNSFSRGAVIIDDVTVNGVNIGDFEGEQQTGTNSIDNRLTANTLDHWKSTGKPPAVYAHLRNLADPINPLVWNELCGAYNSPARSANFNGNCLVMGNQDNSLQPEGMNEPSINAWREGWPGFFTPTLNTKVDRSGGNAANPMGLTESIVDATDGLGFFFDLYTGAADADFTGCGFWFGAQCYPVRWSHNGGISWSNMIGPLFLETVSDPLQIQTFYRIPDDLVGWPTFPNAYNAPDSLRMGFFVYQACYRWGVTVNCDNNGGDGLYYDNMCWGYMDTPLNQVSVQTVDPGFIAPAQIWELIPDAFPANETDAIVGTADFDTTTALVTGPRGIAPGLGDLLTFSVAADTVLIEAEDAVGETRVDMVFRILPGPGNYEISVPEGRTFPPVSTMNLLDVPTNQVNFVTAGDGTFWGQYLGNPGPFSKGDHHGGTYWDYLTWNSARCDTSEQNAFPVYQKFGIWDPTPAGQTAFGVWSNMLHEDDPNFSTLGYDKFICFMDDTAGSASNNNVKCDGTVPTWLTTIPQDRTGYSGSNVTKEFSKIIPDGLLTPGSHVQYFFRKSVPGDANPDNYSMSPDTNVVFQPSEANFDGHRWQQFSVLPDRWKGAEFDGDGMACMLYVDGCDRRGVELVFVALMDSLGGTSPAKYGAHNGWQAPGIYDATYDTLAYFPVHGRNQSPGTTWDMFGVKAAESGNLTISKIGSRLANRAGMAFFAGKSSKAAPTPAMLRTYYRLVTYLSGDLNGRNMGPYFNCSNDDIGILNDFLTAAGGTSQPRGFFGGGHGFVESEDLEIGVPSHAAFLATKLGVGLRNASYQSVSNNTNDCADLLSTSYITSNGDIYGNANNCGFSNDLLERNPAVTEAVEAMYYENVGAVGPYVAAVYKPANAAASRDWVAYTEGFDMQNVAGRFCDTSYGRLAYYYNMYNAIFATQCQVTTTSPPSTLDVPQSGKGAPFANFMKVGNSVMRAGNARIHFGLANADRVRIRMYDVTGRLVRTLADRSFNAGEYDLAWDGADDGGNQVARGVYFARIEYAAKGGAINGRVVVLR